MFLANAIQDTCDTAVSFVTCMDANLAELDKKLRTLQK